jgi:ankyrin repeat protein
MALFKNRSLRVAACYDKADRVKEMLEAGADPEKRDSYGDTVTYDAVRRHSTEAVRVLIAHGVRLDEQVRDGGTLLNFALWNGYTDIAVMLIEACPALADIPGKDGKLPVHQAAWSGQDKALRALLKCKPALATARDGEGETPLHYTAIGGYVESAALLLETGADPAARNDAGRTPLFAAQKHNRMQVADILRPLTPGEIKTSVTETGPAEEWKRLSATRIAHVMVEQAVGYRVTDIFNFESRERLRIVHNIETKADQIENRSFDDFTDMSFIERAGAELKSQGGEVLDGAAQARVLKLSKPGTQP